MRFNFAVFASLVSAALARDVKVLSAFLLEPVSSCIFAIGVPLVTLLLSLPTLQFQGAGVSFSGFLKESRWCLACIRTYLNYFYHRIFF